LYIPYADPLNSPFKDCCASWNKTEIDPADCYKCYGCSISCELASLKIPDRCVLDHYDPVWVDIVSIMNKE